MSGESHVELITFRCGVDSNVRSQSGMLIPAMHLSPYCVVDANISAPALEESAGCWSKLRDTAALCAKPNTLENSAEALEKTRSVCTWLWYNCVILEYHCTFMVQ